LLDFLDAGVPKPRSGRSVVILETTFGTKINKSEFGAGYCVAGQHGTQ
jgi:hypothetical protein